MSPAVRKATARQAPKLFLRPTDSGTRSKMVAKTLETTDRNQYGNLYGQRGDKDQLSWKGGPANISEETEGEAQQGVQLKGILLFRKSEPNFNFRKKN